jgi:hypothetical protein
VNVGCDWSAGHARAARHTSARFAVRMHANRALREAASEGAPYLRKTFNTACAAAKNGTTHILTTTSSAPRKSTGDKSHAPPVSSPWVRDRRSARGRRVQASCGRISATDALQRQPDR